MREHHKFVKTVEGSAAADALRHGGCSIGLGVDLMGCPGERGKWGALEEGESLKSSVRSGGVSGWQASDGGRPWQAVTDRVWGGWRIRPQGAEASGRTQARVAARREGQCACLQVELWVLVTHKERCGWGGSSLRLVTHLWAQMVLGDGSTGRSPQVIPPTLWA